MALAVGQTAVVNVRAHFNANHTNLKVTSGNFYQFSVPPNQVWNDFYIVSSAKGYQKSVIWFIQDFFRGLKPLPEENWFALAGAIDSPENSPFLIGESTKPISMKASGERILFANDAKGFYWNNFGSLLVAFTRVE